VPQGSESTFIISPAFIMAENFGEIIWFYKA
jgi:hypothetical protein